MPDNVSSKELVRALDLLSELKGSSRVGVERCPDSEFQERLDSHLSKRSRSFVLVWGFLILFFLTLFTVAVNEIYELKAVSDDYTVEFKPAFEKIRDRVIKLEEKLK